MQNNNRPVALTEAYITERLHGAHSPGAVASTDGYAEMYENTQLKCAAVLIPLIQCRRYRHFRWKNEWNLVLTRRTDVVEHHKGQVSFPGGGCNSDETTPEQTALREAWEEIGLKIEDVRILGRLNDVITITNYRITPVVGVMPWPYQIRLEPAEVERVFTIPLPWLANRQNWEEKPISPNGTARPFPVVKYRAYNGEILWGASARITQNFLSVLGVI